MTQNLIQTVPISVELLPSGLTTISSQSTESRYIGYLTLSSAWIPANLAEVPISFHKTANSRANRPAFRNRWNLPPIIVLPGSVWRSIWIQGDSTKSPWFSNISSPGWNAVHQKKIRKTQNLFHGESLHRTHRFRDFVPEAESRIVFGDRNRVGSKNRRFFVKTSVPVSRCSEVLGGGRQLERCE